MLGGGEPDCSIIGTLCQAALSIVLDHIRATVFVVVRSSEEREIVSREHPKLPTSHIIDAFAEDGAAATNLNLQLEESVLHATQDHGVNFVLTTETIQQQVVVDFIFNF